MNNLSNIRRHLLLLLLLKVFFGIAELELLPVARRLASAWVRVCNIAGVLVCRIISSRINLKHILPAIISWPPSMRHLSCMPCTLRAVIVDILGLHRIFLWHASEDNFVLLWTHANKIEVKLIADIFLLDNSLLGLWLDFLADHEWWLILLGTLLAVASILRISVIRAISFKASDRFSM